MPNLPNTSDHLLTMTPAQREEFREELLRQIHSVDPEIFSEIVTTSPAQRHERYLLSHLPRWHRALRQMNLLGEWCLAAQARYERRRQELLGQGLELTTAQDLASEEELRPQSEQEEEEQTAVTAVTNLQDQEFLSQALPRLLAELQLDQAEH